MTVIYISMTSVERYQLNASIKPFITFNDNDYDIIEGVEHFLSRWKGKTSRIDHLKAYVLSKLGFYSDMRLIFINMRGDGLCLYNGLYSAMILSDIPVDFISPRQIKRFVIDNIASCPEHIENYGEMLPELLGELEHEDSPAVEMPMEMFTKLRDINIVSIRISATHQDYMVTKYTSPNPIDNYVFLNVDGHIYYVFPKSVNHISNIEVRAELFNRIV